MQKNGVTICDGSHTQYRGHHNVFSETNFGSEEAKFMG